MTTNYIAILLLIASAIIIFFAMGVTIYLQRKRIDELNTPKYGFLNKPITYAFLGIMFSLFISAGFVAFDQNTNQDSNESISVNSTELLGGDITFEIIDSRLNLYFFSLVPTLSGEPWGNNVENVFDIEWTVINSGIRLVEVESISTNKAGGIEYILEPGENIVRATITFNELQYEKEITIRLNK